MSHDLSQATAPRRLLPDVSAAAPRALALGGLFLLALLARSAWLLTGGRLWAEEGALYYARLQDGSLADALTLVASGNYQLLTNLAAWLAGLVPAVWAAHVTTGLALLVAFAVVSLVAALSVQQKWDARWTAAAVLVLAWMPSGYEVWLTSTNIQWLCSVSVLLLVLLDPTRWGRTARAASAGWVGACALTGVPPLTMAPLVLWRAWRSRTGLHVAWAVLLCAGAAIQVAVLASQSHAGRGFRLDPLVTLFASMLQAVLAPVAGVQSLEAMVDWAGRGGEIAVLALVIGGGLALLALAVRAAWSAGQSRLAGLLLAAAALAVLVNVFGAWGAPANQVSAWSGGRYFFLAQICWVLLLLAAVHAAGTASRSVPALLLAAGIASGWYESRTGAWKEFIVSGPSWSATVDSCQGRRPCRVPVWPLALGMHFDLRRP